MNRSAEVLLTIAAAALAVAFFASVPYWPRERIDNPLPSFVSAALTVPNKAPLLGPSVLASAKPAPQLNLALPDSIATVVRRSGINGETGLIPTTASITTFRLNATGDLVSVAMVENATPVSAPSAASAQSLEVRGHYAIASVDRGVTHIRWTENGITFDMASRTLEPLRLIDVANKLH